MGGDYSRKSFDALRHFAGVLMQQGHVTLDADWNEFVAIVERRLRTETADIIGRAVVPKETPTGFQIVSAAGPKLTIGRGRMYVDGLLAENHGGIGPASAAIFDRSRLDEAGRAVGVLDESISREAGDFIDYLAQPYLPAAPALPATPGPHLIYLDVWNREVTPLKDPRLLEPALNGIDTATRLQTVWQVRVLADVGADATCGADLAAWNALVAPSSARLTTATVEFEDPDEPCLLPPGGGYRGLENQFYRVELHVGGGLANARFKWSRDNASVGTTIEAIANGGSRLQVRRIGRDSILRFRTGDWVEITDDRREFAGLAGDLRRIEVDEDANELRLAEPLSADLIPTGGADTTASRHSRVIRWDQHGEVRLEDGTLWADLDASGSDGLIPVPPAGQAVVLEAGITVRFDMELAAGAAKAMDHWCFAARTAGAGIEILDRAPPLGVHHHYARLGLVTFPSTVVDCRTFWPPDFGHDCACTVCVSAEEHNSGTFTIQQAVAALPETGGTICLSPGTFILGDNPILINGRQSVRLRGHGAATFLVYAGVSGAIRIIESEQIEILDISVLISTDAPNALEAPAAFLVRTCERVKLQRNIALMLPRDGARGFGVAVDGSHNGIDISDNLLFAPTAIGALANPDREEGLRYCALEDALIHGNRLIGSRGVALDGLVMHLAVTRIVLNTIDASDEGIVVTGTAAINAESDLTADRLARNEAQGLGGVAIEGNTIRVGALGSGVISGVPNLHLTNNEISRFGGQEGPETACCVRLTEGFMPKLQPDSYIVGNRMSQVFGFGISIEANQANLVIKQNLIRDCEAGGVHTLPEAQIGSLSFDNNTIDRVGNGTRSGRAIGVSLSSIVDGKVIGNTISRVGQAVEAAEYVAGLEVRGAILLDISHNTISDIGLAAGPRELYAIRLHGPMLSAEISANRLIGATFAADNDPGSWGGIVLDARLGSEGGQIPGGPATGVNRFPAFVAAGDRILSLTRRGVSALGRAQNTQIRIDGNLINDARQRSQLPLVLVLAGGDKLSGCIFTGNQCRRLGDGGVTPVILQAQRLAVANNMVRLESEADAMALQSGTFNGPTATILGNITFGNIRLNGAALPALWQQLNVLG